MLQWMGCLPAEGQQACPDGRAQIVALPSTVEPSERVVGQARLRLRYQLDRQGRTPPNPRLSLLDVCWDPAHAPASDAQRYRLAFADGIDLLASFDGARFIPTS